MAPTQALPWETRAFPASRTAPHYRKLRLAKDGGWIIRGIGLQELSWSQIEDKFATFFNLRTKDGFTSVYYRTRKDWGMEEVLKAGHHGSISDRGKVESKAARFPREVLTNLGYFD